MLICKMRTAGTGLRSLQVCGGDRKLQIANRKCRGPTPHPSRSGWWKRRRETPSPQGRGLFIYLAPSQAILSPSRTAVFLQRSPSQITNRKSQIR